MISKLIHLIILLSVEGYSNRTINHNLQIVGGSNMAKCCRCGKRFNVSEARDEYIDEFGREFDGDLFDDQYGREVCADCAIADTETLMNIGKAIDMMNGEEEYDEDFVNRWL
jgi:hypothetical protein